jgi:hypothetical protein
VAAYGSLDQPTYQIDITPFLPLLTDSAPHNFTLAVEGQGENGSINSKWFLSGNIAITLDASGKRTTGEILSYRTDPYIQITGGVCGSSICTTTDANRKLYIESSILTGSNQRKKVSFKQDLVYQNRQIFALDGSSQVSFFVMILGTFHSPNLTLYSQHLKLSSRLHSYQQDQIRRLQIQLSHFPMTLVSL